MKTFHKYSSFEQINDTKNKKSIKRLLIIVLVVAILVMLLPWTQNIQAPGNVTALNPENRPQTINAVIGGRIEKWFIQEGDSVKKGDTLAFISEIKAEYMDPQLVQRTEQAMRSKESSAGAYMQKVQSLDQQIDAMIDGKVAKINQAQNKLKQARYKIQGDSMDFKANEKQLKIAIDQFKRTEELFNQKLKSLTDVENKRLKVQEMEAKVVSLENKLFTSRNELLNAQVELSNIDAEFRDKIAKSEAEKSSTLSNLFDTEATVTKMQNEVTNYSMRSSNYFITAPQDGFISKALFSGIGEIIKEGAPLMTIVPSKPDLAVEFFIDPVDLPLVHIGNNVRLQFDGWPAIVFSGWPQVSYGSYGGKIMAIDNFIGENGKYRILVAPDKKDHQWPKGLRMGVAVKSMTLLNNVPIWYELWRKINGFPPDYYTKEVKKNKAEEKESTKKEKE